MSSAPHHPGRGGSKSAGESEHLNTSITLEGRVGNDSVLDGISGTGTNSDGSEHLEDGAKDHGLAVCDRPR